MLVAKAGGGGARPVQSGQELRARPDSVIFVKSHDDLEGQSGLEAKEKSVRGFKSRLPSTASLGVYSPVALWLCEDSTVCSSLSGNSALNSGQVQVLDND